MAANAASISVPLCAFRTTICNPIAGAAACTALVSGSELGLAGFTISAMTLAAGTSAQTPSRSRAEMEALASVHSIQSVMLPRGKLSVHEEFPDFVAEAIEPFLLDRSRMKNPGCA